MDILIKIIKVTGIFMLLLVLSIPVYIYFSVPSLPEGAKEIVEQVREHPLPEVIKGKTGYARSQGVNIWYESISPKDSSKGAVLLIMGISTDAFGWPHKFMNAFVDSGYQVIRYDHRGTGMSDWLENWTPMTAYSLADMAEDCIAIMDTLGIEKANIVGLSMGGMIAQELAIHHPERVATLTSIMSSGYIEDPALPKISKRVAFKLIRAGLKYQIIGGEENILKLSVAVRIILRGDANYELNIKEICEDALYNLRKRRGYNSKVSFQHQAAVSLSGSRYSKLSRLKVPTLIIHGKVDPFIPIEHGKKCAAIIPNADSCWIEGMAHDIPDVFTDTVANKIMADFNRRISK